MTFNDTTTKNGLIQRCEDWLFSSDYGKISNNTNLLLKFTNLLNSGMDKTTTLIQTSDGTWQYDDPNRTDIAEGTTDLSNGISTYRLDLSHLKIDGAEVMNANGLYQVVTPIDYADIRALGMTPTEFRKQSGLPQYYDVKGDIMTLFPAPATASVTMTNGLKVVYQREPNYYTSLSTTTEIGLPRMYQDFPYLFACSEYCKQNTMWDKAKEIDEYITKRSEELQTHFNKREKEDVVEIRGEQIDSR